MSTDNCTMCKKKFAWYRWRYSCQRCNATACSSCLSYNIKGEYVCDNCHCCGQCNSMVIKDTLTIVREHYLCKRCYDGYMARISNWISGTKNETLGSCVITKEIGLIRVNDECKAPGDVEEILKIETAVAGGNSYVKLFWDKHIEHHEEEYQAGTGPNGNPYYKTRHWTTHYFTGHATAVVAKPYRKNV